MGKIIYSVLSQDYGYESSGEQVKIELVFKISGGANQTITVYLTEGESYTVTEIWASILTTWNAYPWAGGLVPILTIDQTTGIGTIVESAVETVTFQTMKIYYNENNPRSLELPMILGATDFMAVSTGSVTINLGNDFAFTMPYMGTWRIQCVLDNGQGFESSISTWTPIKSKIETNTDVSRKTISNGAMMTIRGYKVKIDMVPYKYLKSYDLFLDFASRGTAEVILVFGFYIFGDNTVNGHIWGSESGEETLLFDNEQLMSYQVGLLPKSNLEA